MQGPRYRQQPTVTKSFYHNGRLRPPHLSTAEPCSHPRIVLHELFHRTNDSHQRRRADLDSLRGRCSIVCAKNTQLKPAMCPASHSCDSSKTLALFNREQMPQAHSIYGRHASPRLAGGDRGRWKLLPANRTIKSASTARSRFRSGRRWPCQQSGHRITPRESGSRIRSPQIAELPCPRMLRNLSHR
jgi:hypothetical protein